MICRKRFARANRIGSCSTRTYAALPIIFQCMLLALFLSFPSAAHAILQCRISQVPNITSEQLVKWKILNYEFNPKISADDDFSWKRISGEIDDQQAVKEFLLNAITAFRRDREEHGEPAPNR